MIQAIKQFTRLLQHPERAWKQLLGDKDKDSAHFYQVYWIMALIIPFSAIGKTIALAEFNGAVLISDALLTFVSLFTALHIGASVIKLYYEHAEKQTISYNSSIEYTAYASAAVYASVWLIEITQMPIFWLGALYSLKIVLASIQSGYLPVDAKRQYNATWIISLVIITLPYLVQNIIGMIINV